MKATILTGAAMTALLTLAPAAARAATVSDASGDFLADYAGPQNGDLDILGASAYFDGTNFRLAALLNGPVGTTHNSLFVWGIDRGAGTERLQFMGAPPPVGAGVSFDAVAVLFPAGNALTVTIPAMGFPTATPLVGAITIDGNSISALIPASRFPSTGFAPTEYRFTLWSRQRANLAMDGTNIEIADFAPNASGFAPSIPEPTTWAMMIGGFGLVGGMLRRRPATLAA